MRTALRKMGNSTGVILPRTILGRAGLGTGAVMQVSVEGERVVLTPVDRGVRAGWEEAAAEIGRLEEPEGDAWLGFSNEDDADLVW